PDGALERRGHEGGGRLAGEQVLADAARVEHHLAAVVDQHGDVDVAAGEGGQLGAIAVGDVDVLVLAAHQVEQQLHLEDVGAVGEPVELHGSSSTPRGVFSQTICSHDTHEICSCMVR